MLVMTSLLILTGIIIIDLFSTQSHMLSTIKSGSVYNTYLFFIRDVYQYHLDISGWNFLYPTYFLPTLVLYLLLGPIFQGFYSSLALVIIMAVSFFVIAVWLLNLIFQNNIKSKWHVTLFTSIILGLLCINPAIIVMFPVTNFHGGTILLSFLFIALSLQQLKRPNLYLLVTLLLLNILFIYSDFLYVVSCVFPFALALLISNMTQRRFDKKHAQLLYGLAVSTFFGSLCASYLRQSDYSLHATLSR